jgi:hypothetical protein
MCQQNYVSVHAATKMIKLSFDDNDFKIAHPSDFFFSRTITINFDKAQTASVLNGLKNDPSAEFIDEASQPRSQGRS